MSTFSPARRFGQLRAIAVSGMIIGSLAAGAIAYSTTAADAATTASGGTAVSVGSILPTTAAFSSHSTSTRIGRARSAVTCREVSAFIPQGDYVEMIEPSSGLRVLVDAYLIASYPTPVGYVQSWDSFSGQSWQSLVNSPLNSSFPVEVSSFGVALEYNFAARQWAPEVIYNTCTWTGYLIS
jgi:hypothetical protein